MTRADGSQFISAHDNEIPFFFLSIFQPSGPVPAPPQFYDRNVGHANKSGFNIKITVIMLSSIIFSLTAFAFYLSHCPLWPSLHVLFLFSLPVVCPVTNIPLSLHCHSGRLAFALGSD